MAPRGSVLNRAIDLLNVVKVVYVRQICSWYCTVEGSKGLVSICRITSAQHKCAVARSLIALTNTLGLRPGHTAAWALYLVSQHPRVEAKVVEELARHGLLATPQKPQPRLPLYEDLAKLSYLRCVIEACNISCTSTIGTNFVLSCCWHQEILEVLSFMRRYA